MKDTTSRRKTRALMSEFSLCARKKSIKMVKTTQPHSKTAVRTVAKSGFSALKVYQSRGEQQQVSAGAEKYIT